VRYSGAKYKKDDGYYAGAKRGTKYVLFSQDEED